MIKFPSKENSHQILFILLILFMINDRQFISQKKIDEQNLSTKLMRELKKVLKIKQQEK